MSTPHINANKGDIAETILLPGDPLRAKFIAENFLTDVVQFNSIRNILGYTGKYNGKEVSVMGSGMGIPSIGIYSYELITQFGVKNLIRIGSAGAYQKHLNLYDIVIGMGACSDSNFAEQYGLPGNYSAICSYDLLTKVVNIADREKIDVHVGNIYSSDVFYNAQNSAWQKWERMGVLAVEMESYGLYCNASYLGANALCIATISDSFHFEKLVSPEEREKGFTNMMKIALETL